MQSLQHLFATTIQLFTSPMTSNCGGHVISQSEIARMRASTLPPTENYERDSKRAHLKILSNDKLKNWPNTLEALRTKKESFLKEKEEAAEEKRKQLDREEADYRRQTRLESIERANKMLFEQTDRMKYLRSQELLSDVVHERVSQLADKQKVIVREKEVDMAHHQVILEQVRTGELKEKEKEERIQKKIAEVKVARKTQLDEVRNRKMAEMDEERQIGLAMKRDAETRLQEEIAAREEKAKRIKEANAKTLLANEKLKLIRDEHRSLEEEEQRRREAEVDVIENRKMVRKALEVRKFEKAQQTRQEIIKAATKALADSSGKVESIRQKQEDESKAKQDKYFADKEERRVKEWKETVDSRTAQIEAKKERTRIEAEEERVMVNLNKLQLQEAQERESEKVRKAMESTNRIKKDQFESGVLAIKNKVESRIIEVEKDKLTISLHKVDDDKFKKVCLEEIKRYEEAGKPVYPLYKALEYKEPDLLPVTGFRI